MKKLFKLLIISTIISIIIIGFSSVFAASNIIIPGENDLKKTSIEYTVDGDIVTTVNDTGYKMLSIFKILLQGILLIIIVYTGGQMIMSMGDNEEQLSGSKRQLWYSIIALIFINIPGTLYEAFKKDNYGTIDGKINKGSFVSDSLDGNIFLNPFNFGYTFEDNIIGFFKVAIYASAILMFILAAYRIMMAKGEEEEVTKSKKYFFNAIIALIFAGMIDVWRYVVFDGSINQGINLFSKLANIALFFAGPVAILFLTLAGYYYITSNGDDEKVKKSKSIVINTILGVLIILASYTFLVDLANL